MEKKQNDLSSTLFTESPTNLTGKPPGFSTRKQNETVAIDLFKTKFIKALTTWGLKKEGQKFQRLLAVGQQSFWMRVCLYRSVTGCDIVSAIEQIPLSIPTRLRKQDSPFAPDTSFNVLSEYEQILARAQKIQKKKWRNPASRLLTLKEKFPGVPEHKIKEYASMNPSDIALDYVVWKYNLPVSGEAVKKYLISARQKKSALEQGLDEAETKGLIDSSGRAEITRIMQRLEELATRKPEYD